MAAILIIDDERQVRDSVRQMLEKEGHKVRVAEDGAKGVAEFEKGPVDLVITDILMPEQDGYDTIRQLVASRPGLSILAISGGATVLRKEFGLEAAKLFGATHVLSKPFTRAELLEAVAKAMEKPAP